MTARIGELLGDLDEVQVRVLGALVEKESTTPDVYPMTTNGLVSACNQKTSRDPVVSFTAVQIDTALLSLRELGLVRMVRVQGSRSTKHRHVLQEALELSDPQTAVLAVLFLRSAQTPGELRGRTERIHHFDQPEDVDRVLAALADRDAVVQLARQPGQKEARWIAATTTAHAAASTAPAVAPVVADHSPPEQRSAAPAQPAAPAPLAPSSSAGVGNSSAPSEVAELRAELADLTRRFNLLCDALGEHPE